MAKTKTKSESGPVNVATLPKLDGVRVQWLGNDGQLHGEWLVATTQDDCAYTVDLVDRDGMALGEAGREEVYTDTEFKRLLADMERYKDNITKAIRNLPTAIMKHVTED